MTTQEIANQLVALCRAGKNVEAVDTLLSEGVVSVEARGDETMPAEMSGRDVIRGKNEWWINNHKIHSAQVKGPYPNGDRFAVIFNFVVTPVSGPMAGQKMVMEEVALYTVTDGKISREEFFYDMSGGGDPEPAPARKAKAKKAAPKKSAPRKAAAKTAAKKVAAKPKTKAKVVKRPAAKGKAKTKPRR